MSNVLVSAPTVPTEDYVRQKRATAHKPRSRNPKSLSAEEHHLHLLKCYRLGNRVRREFIEALLSVDEQRLYLKLGSPSIQHYAERYFRYEPALTYEFLRVSRPHPQAVSLGDVRERREPARRAPMASAG